MTTRSRRTGVQMMLAAATAADAQQGHLAPATSSLHPGPDGKLVYSADEQEMRLGLAVRGLYGEGTEALGNVFQVSNQMTLGESENGIVERLEKVLGQIIEHEENARGTLLEKKSKMVLNHIGRAYGILANAHTITSKETMNLLSLMRLGVDLGVFPGVDRSLVDELFLVTQPAHLQKQHSEKLSAEERDLLRADMVRERLKPVSRPISKPPQSASN